MNTKRLQLAHRSALSELITDIINVPRFDTHEKQVIAFASLYSRIMHNNCDITYIMSLSTGGLNKQPTDNGVYQLALKINSYIHTLRDVEGNHVFNQATGELGLAWQSTMVDYAHSLEAIMPDAFLPSGEPAKLAYPSHGNGVPLINTKRKFGYQMPKDMPRVYQALNILQKQEFKLSPDMKALKFLPIALEPSKNYAARHVMLTNMQAFKDSFYFRFTMDYRGRVYCRAIGATTQGDSFSKAFLEFANPVCLGKYGHAALKIHFANCSGYDKLSFIERIKWATTKGILKAYTMVTKCNNDWREISRYIEDPKHAFEEYTAACELVRADQWILKGNDIADMPSTLITHQDATNSGFQFGAALTGNRHTAELVNITPIQTKYDAPADLYNEMSKAMHRQLSEDYLPEWRPVIDRTFCKKPIMTTGYGASLNTVMMGSEVKKGSQGILQYMTKYVIEKPQFASLVDKVEDLKEPVEKALKETASAMLEVTRILQEHAEEILALGAETIEWPTADGLQVIQQKRDNSGRRIELGNKQTTFRKTKRGSSDPIDAGGMTRALSPNFVHSIDAQMLRTATLSTDILGIAFAPIHDSFGTHAGTFFDLNDVLKEAFVETMEFDWYGEFCKRNKVNPKKLVTGDYRAIECLKATYMFS